MDAFSAFDLAFKGDDSDQTTLLSLIKVCSASVLFESTSELAQAVLTFLSGDHTNAIAHASGILACGDDSAKYDYLQVRSLSIYITRSGC